VMRHAMAFARVMIAHARFEAQVRDLQAAITGDQDFSERACNQWGARQRPKRMVKLLEERLGDVAEAPAIADILTKAIKPSDARSLLAHGVWWRFKRDTSVLTVRRGTIRKGEPAHVHWTVADISQVADMFGDLEAELFNVRRELERNWVETTVQP
jgi:hypothetical protein